MTQYPSSVKSVADAIMYENSPLDFEEICCSCGCGLGNKAVRYVNGEPFCVDCYESYCHYEDRA